MDGRLRVRLGSEVIFASLTAVVGALTAVYPSWIEAVFAIDPDHGSGALEWAIVGVCFVATVVSLLAARACWREARAG
jgi:hypothetical protein